MRNSKKYWKVPDQPDTRLRAEQDVPTEDRISMQPFHALLDILGWLEEEPGPASLAPDPTDMGIEASRRAALAGTGGVCTGREVSSPLLLPPFSV